MKAVLAVAAAALLVTAAPAFAAPVTPALPEFTVTGGPTDALFRMDADGGRTLVLNIEDDPAGAYAYTRVITPPALPQAREAGAFTNTYTRNGAPMVAVGAFVDVDGTGGKMRVPLVLFENVASTGAVIDAAVIAVVDALDQGLFAVPYALELLLPEYQAYFSAPPPDQSYIGFVDYPTVYAWTVARSTDAGETWVGSYLQRSGATARATGSHVTSAEKDVEFGAAYRDGAETVHAGGVYTTQWVNADWRPGDGSEQSTTYEVGLAPAPGSRVPLTRVALADDRTGPDFAATPRTQSTRATVSLMVDGEPVPVVGAETTNAMTPTSEGFDVTRVHSAGIFVDGDYTPVVGSRYHSDRDQSIPVLLAAAFDGLGAESVGNFEMDVGTFADGTYVPVAGLQYRTGFRDARDPFSATVALGAYGPLGFIPLVMLTYDGTQPLTPWLDAYLLGQARAERWLIAVGTAPAGAFVPVIGVEGIGHAPLGTRAQQQEFRVGVFAGSYHAFVPVASVAFDGDETPLEHAILFVNDGTFGAQADDFDVTAGAYANGDYVPVARLAFDSEADPAWSNATLVSVGVFAGDTFVPVAGLSYGGDAPLVWGLNGVLNARDDERSRVAVGVFVDGEFVPVASVDNDGDAVRVTVVP